jgi:hypothetical protein
MANKCTFCQDTKGLIHDKKHGIICRQCLEAFNHARNESVKRIKENSEKKNPSIRVNTGEMAKAMYEISLKQANA